MRFLLLGVHFAKVINGMVQSIAGSYIDSLLGLHGALHHCVVAFEGVKVIFLGVKNAACLYTLAEAVFRDSSYYFPRVLLLSVDPACHLVNVLGVHVRSKLTNLDHCFPDRRASLTDLRDNHGIVEYSAGNLAVPATKTKNEMEGALLLDVVVAEGAAILQLLSGKDQALLIRGDSLLVLNLLLDIIYRVRGLDIKGDCLSCQRLDKDLHSTSEAKDQVEGALLLDVVVAEGAAILQLLSGKDQALLIRRDSLLVLNLLLDIINCVRWLDIKGDSLSSESLDENLHCFFSRL